MKRICSVLVLLFCAASFAKAAPGDTTWVSAHNGTWLSNFGNYDTAISFPNGTTSYRKIFMVFTLGKYACPGTPQYCSDWDYTVQNFLMTPTGDTLELGRLITPYGNGVGMGASWSHRYVFDVTDFYPVLKNNADMRVHYSGYSGGFTAKIDFAFIEGTPERNVLKVERVYKGSYAYGNAADPIDNHFPAVTATAPAGTESAELKFTVTGHGADGAGCSEFCSRYYDVAVNGANVAHTDIWRDDCGTNQVSAQNGTWIYDRGNWCPGALVHVNSHKLTGVTAGSSYDVNIDFESYTGSGAASYITEAVVIYYGALNRTLDASLQIIKKPTNHEMFKRDNPICGQPIVMVRNSGSTPITSLKFEHGVTGTFLPTYYVEESIAPMEEKEIQLPQPWELFTATGTQSYEARLIEINGQSADDDATNNSLKTTFQAAPRWGVRTVVQFKTNNKVNETSWKVYDIFNNVVAQRVGAAANTTYVDTLVLGPSCYRLEVTDNGCDGLYWWANPSAGSGFMQLNNIDQGGIGITMPHYLNRDFGCGFTEYFSTAWPVGVANANAATSARLDAFPNPATQSLNISLFGVQQANGTFTLSDATGRVVWQQAAVGPVNQLSVEPFANGIYNLVYRSADGSTPQMQTRVVIAK